MENVKNRIYTLLKDSIVKKVIVNDSRGIHDYFLDFVINPYYNFKVMLFVSNCPMIHSFYMTSEDKHALCSVEEYAEVFIQHWDKLKSQCEFIADESYNDIMRYHKYINEYQYINRLPYMAQLFSLRWNVMSKESFRALCIHPPQIFDRFHPLTVFQQSLLRCLCSVKKIYKLFVKTECEDEYDIILLGGTINNIQFLCSSLPNFTNFFTDSENNLIPFNIKDYDVVRRRCFAEFARKIIDFPYVKRESQLNNVFQHYGFLQQDQQIVVC